MRTRSKMLGVWLVAALVSATVVTSFARPAEACSQPFVGQICTFAFSYCPQGFAQAAGQLLPIQNNVELFSLLGNTYGGDGRTNFALPDLRGRTAIGTGQGLGLPDISLGETSGGDLTVNVLKRATGTPVDVSQLPSLGLTYCIDLVGAFPPRN